MRDERIHTKKTNSTNWIYKVNKIIKYLLIPPFRQTHKAKGQFDAKRHKLPFFPVVIRFDNKIEDLRSPPAADKFFSSNNGLNYSNVDFN